ncbi:MAG: UDP-N-acetylmuramoyl-L-alanyl-D-glutamate--2,6-diaminopimelate ligase [Planctomycetota bacterium]
MRLSELAAQLEGAHLRGNGGVEIGGLTCDSRSVKRGMLFAALAGTKLCGEDFIPEAVRKGAAAILAENAVEGLAVPLVTVPDARRALAFAAEYFYGRPSRRLDLFGVTGTNGKTTTACLLRHLLVQAGRPTGLLGTITYETGREKRPAPLTTPDSVAFSAALAEMVKNGCRAAVAEVSSHALDQSRAAGVRFSAAVFTNLTRDHLDYHGDLERYAKAKLRLFEMLPAGAPAILNADDPFAWRIAQATQGKVLRYGFSPENDLSATVENLSLDGSDVTLRFQDRNQGLHTGLIGMYNIQNIMAAALAALSQDVPLGETARAIASFPGVAGRLERIPSKGGSAVFVDYAHTDDALRNVLGTLRSLTQGRLIALFGCGGDRDRGKRPLMAEAAEDAADLVIVTQDNPRTEAPERIFRDIRQGFRQPEAVFFQPDRARAIRLAVERARPEDTVLIAGKGHENYQIFGTRRIPFDDRAVAAEAVRNCRAEEGAAGAVRRD